MRSFFTSLASLTFLTASTFVATSADAQQPFPQQQPQQPPPGYQPYPQQQPPPGYQPYPQQQPPPGYGPAPGGYQPPPPGYGPPPGQYPPPGYQPPPPGYGPPPGQYPPGAPPPANDKRSDGEMTALYITSALWGIGSGITLDALFKIKDPGVAIIMPIVLGGAAPVGAFFWDSQGGPLHKGVPASLSGGLVLGAIEGISITGVQWQFNHEKTPPKSWSFAGETGATWIFATAGGVGGWAFGEAVSPDPRNVGFIVGGSGWGAGSGIMMGIAVSGKDWKDGAAVAGLIGYNVGIVGAGAISLGHTASWESQKYMWMGYGLGALGGCLIFPLYLFSDADPKHGFIGPSLGGLVGLGIAGALTWNLQDPGDKRGQAFKPPFDIAVLPTPKLNPAFGVSNDTQGAMLSGSGTF